jgi:hypothetical protein
MRFPSCIARSGLSLSMLVASPSRGSACQQIYRQSRETTLCQLRPDTRKNPGLPWIFSHMLAPEGTV